MWERGIGERERERERERENLFKAVAEVHITRDEEPFELANREGVERTR